MDELDVSCQLMLAKALKRKPFKKVTDLGSMIGSQLLQIFASVKPADPGNRNNDQSLYLALPLCGERCHASLPFPFQQPSREFFKYV